MTYTNPRKEKLLDARRKNHDFIYWFETTTDLVIKIVDNGDVMECYLLTRGEYEEEHNEYLEELEG